MSVENRLISFLRSRFDLLGLEHAAFLDDGHQSLHKSCHEMILDEAVQLQKSKRVGEDKAVLIEDVLVGQDVGKDVQFGYL